MRYSAAGVVAEAHLATCSHSAKLLREQVAQQGLAGRAAATMRSLALMEAAPRSGGSGPATLPWPDGPDASPTAGSPVRLYHAAMREGELHTATTECLPRFAAVLDAMWGLEPRSHHDHRPQRHTRADILVRIVSSG